MGAPGLVEEGFGGGAIVPALASAAADDGVSGSVALAKVCQCGHIAGAGTVSNVCGPLDD